ncbi:MAG: TetR/AcrR family transcriptional regulator [Deltaproteobacteria bacterium]|nr:TetR/AcrR family transcriptional regulator [Deltaproteobacteria bacterium]
MAARGAVAERSVERAIERRRAAYEEEVGRLVDASFALIRREGHLEPKVGEIVAAAGLSNQAFYKHFRSKDELLLAVLDEGFRRLGEYLERRMQKARTPERRIRQWINGVLEQALDAESARASRPFALSRGRLAELFPDEVRTAEQRLVDPLRESIEEAVRAGELAAADPERDAALIYGLAMGWVERQLMRSEPPSRRDAEHLLEFAMRGLRRLTTDPRR